MKKILTVILLLFGAFLSYARATDFSSSNFIIRDPHTSLEGGRSTSGNFEIFSSSSSLTTGESTGSSFILRSGFLYFPVATSPVITATPGNGQVTLFWTTSVGTLANITNYQVGTAAVSGGPYTFESVGNTFSFIKTGLSNGTPYYFRVRAQAGAENLAISGEVPSTPVFPSPSPTPSPQPLAGGGGTVYLPPVANVIFSGRAYPLSKVTILKDGQIAAITIAGPDANFYVSLSGLTGGNYMFSVFGEDNKGRNSVLFTFPSYITQGVTTQVSGIFLAPTVEVSKSEVRKGDDIAILGQSVAGGEITIAVNSPEEFFAKVTADKNGAYLYNFDTTPLEIGQHSAKAKARLNDQVSPFGKSVGFSVGEESIASERKCRIADSNCDGRVNLIDFSILLYWWNKPNANADLNANGLMDLADFSIMLYYWTG